MNSNCVLGAKQLPHDARPDDVISPYHEDGEEKRGKSILKRRSLNPRTFEHRRIFFENDAAEKSSAKLGIPKGDCVCYALVFLYTIFSLVSATIIRTFNYDRRLEAVTGDSYLIADYKIHKSDADQKVYVVYAGMVFVVNCV